MRATLALSLSALLALATALPAYNPDTSKRRLTTYMSPGKHGILKPRALAEDAPKCTPHYRPNDIACAPGGSFCCDPTNACALVPDWSQPRRPPTGNRSRADIPGEEENLIWSCWWPAALREREWPNGRCGVDLDPCADGTGCCNKRAPPCGNGETLCGNACCTGTEMCNLQTGLCTPVAGPTTANATTTDNISLVPAFIAPPEVDTPAPTVAALPSTDMALPSTVAALPDAVMSEDLPDAVMTLPDAVATVTVIVELLAAPA